MCRTRIRIMAQTPGFAAHCVALADSREQGESFCRSLKRLDELLGVRPAIRYWVNGDSDDSGENENKKKED